MSCQTLTLIDDNYYSIRKYIECVFDDGDLSEEESGNESSNTAESSFDRVTSEPRDVDILNAKDCNPSNTDKNGASEGVQLSLANRSNDDSFLSIVSQPPDNDLLMLASKNEKVKFSLKTPRSVLLKQSQMCLEEPETSKVQLFLPGRTSTTFTTKPPREESLSLDNVVNEDSRCKSTSPRIEDNLERSCIQSSRKASTSSSSSNSTSKNRHSGSKTKSKSKLHRLKHSPHKLFKDKLRNASYNRDKNYLSKSSSRKGSNKRDSKRGTPKRARTRTKRSASSESERIIAAQFLPPFRCKDNGAVSSERRTKEAKLKEGDADDVRSAVYRKDYKNKIPTPEKDSNKSHPISNYLEKQHKKNDSEMNSNTISPLATFNSDDENSDTHKSLLTASPNSDRLSRHNPRSSSDRNLGSGRTFNLWNIDPLLVNSIPTDEDILITQDKVKELKMSLKSKTSESISGDKISNKVRSFEEETGEIKGPSCSRANPKCTCDAMLLKSAIGSLETHEDVTYCFGLLSRRLHRLMTKSESGLNSKMKKFVKKLRNFLKIELDFDETDLEAADSSLLQHDRFVVPSCESTRVIQSEQNYTVHKSNILNRDAFNTKCRKRVSIVSPVSSGTESENGADDLQVIEQQIKAVLNPAILRSEITKDEYGEIVRMVVTKVGQCRKRLYKFDCNSFLRKTLQAVKRRKLS